VISLAGKKDTDKKQSVSPGWGVPSEAHSERGAQKGTSPSTDDVKKKRKK